MISARLPNAGPVLDRIARSARAIAEAREQRLHLAARNDPRRWRDAGLLWPLFTKER